MNGTLTGLGIALVLALVTALVGPFFVDWGDHRAAFEAQASKLLGVPVRVLGEVDARLLPSPRIRFGQVVAGDEWAASRFTADSFELDIALMPMLGGEFKVTSLRIDGADLKASLAADGEISLPIAAGMSVTELDAITITDVDIRNSRITIADPAANKNTVVENVRLQGEASSLAGPMKFEARGKIGERTYTVNAATGRFDGSGAGRVKVAIGSDVAPDINLDGAIVLGKKPLFEGTGSIVQTASAEGQPAREPWRIAGEVTANIRRLDAEKVDFEYGQPGRELRLAGGLGVIFGPKPSAEIRLKARQIDLDRALGRKKEEAPLPPAEVLAALAQRFPAMVSTPIPVRLTADVENVALGGDYLQGVRGTLVSTPGGWTVEQADAHLPGGATVDASGVLLVRDGEGPRFTGPVQLDAPNVPALVHWIDGLGGDRPRLALKTLTLDAALAARPGSYALEDMKANADGAEIAGRLAFTRAEGSRNRLEMRLTAERLDLDALDLERLAGAAGDGQGTDVELTLRAAKLDYARVTWTGVDIDLSANEGAVDIRRLTIADLGGARIAATGGLSEMTDHPAGRLEAKIEAQNLDGLVAVLRTSSLPPALLDAIEARAAVIAPASLTAVLSSAGGSSTAGVTTRVAGTLGGTAVEFTAQAPKFALGGPIDARLTASSADGARLFSQLGIPAVALESFGPATIEGSIKGDLSEGADVKAVIAANADRLVFDGRRSGEGAISGRLDVEIEDAARYAVLLARAPPASLPAIPLKVGADLVRDAEGLRLNRLAGLVQGRAIGGTLRRTAEEGVQGSLEIESLSLSEVAGLALGPLALTQPDAAGWPAGPLGPDMLQGLEGRITVRTGRFAFAPGHVGTDTKFDLAFGRNEFSVQDLESVLAGGPVKGNLAVRRADEELSVAARVTLEDAGLEHFVWADAATGKLDLTADILGTGKNLAAVVGNLSGSGSFTLRDARLGAVDAGAFERTLIAIESAGTEPPDAEMVSSRFGSELAMADLEVAEMSSAFTIAGGVVRISNAAIAAPLVNATASGTVDLAKHRLAAHMSLRPKVLPDIEDVSIPAAELSLTGPWRRPERSADTTAFANLLAVRAVEREIARVERLEAERIERERKAAEEQARLKLEEEKRAAEEAEAARLKAIRDATGEIPIGALPPPVELRPRPAPASPSGGSANRRQSPLDFLRRPVVPEAAR